MTHVFIVNDQTFKYHLEYLFAGTGAGNKLPIFLDKATIAYNASTERNLVGMIADISRIRENDEVFFYLTGCAKFYGFFKVKNQAFSDVNGQYLFEGLEKSLTFRVLLEPNMVYADGVTEHEFLDSLDGISAPHEMCWSLIYRKLKGNRGCTAIFDYEADRLKRLIRAKNNNVHLNGHSFSYDSRMNRIIVSNQNYDYAGKVQPIGIKERLLFKAMGNNAFEAHLQAHIMQNFEQIAIILDIPANSWFANEVSCGVGMQRIDIMVVSQDSSSVNVFVIELKHHPPDNDIISFQLPWYLQWCSDYVVPNFKAKQISITPTILAREFSNRHQLEIYKDFVGGNILLSKNAVVLPTQYVSFAFDKNNLTFKREF